MVLIELFDEDYIISNRLYNEDISIDLLLGSGEVDVYVHLLFEEVGVDSYPIHYTITKEKYDKVLGKINDEYNKNFQYIDNILKRKNLTKKLIKRERQYGAYRYYFNELLEKEIDYLKQLGLLLKNNDILFYF